ncbi:Y-family DNA polymerase [Phaeobacter gallaeciensis]|uniref:DNA-directed DNA polymerase n=1 Tax=Phaeobacter gallaeciensis TaxID=60890 RepID=A0ABD4XDV9_9RHOB|nr:DNA polymerase Y family protein [Phaeobacter gallaeciensis]MDE4142159.1 DNA polymerase Y family protein [Phaeobacter gallaeciensis]MDE4146645.1 DNA polymerase Y family protein [Phaeobacter gallaeciensis]MDE4150600.1 DNA polymerase Y family protein [Phaeobacter gallaeciensis]MDE4154897.1 DNA polymerase Y family protein [Phaeobacter gallaeciensis]MDE4159213.1 DNA polymerase Y family protein [Phaeobacter gallaeciensis]
MARRLLSIRFPRLASDTSLRRRPVEGPFALIHRSGNADHVHCLNQAAEMRGLHPGMAAADARAICPELITRPADLAREAAALAGLRRWAGRYSPMVARDGPDGLIADISGVPHLFGGEAEMRGDLHARLERVGLTLSSAIAETRGAAQALARHGGGILPEGIAKEGIAGLPVSALRIGSDVAEGLARMGLNRIGDLTDLPRAPLARRFGPGLVLRLDQALGLQPEPVSPEADAPYFGVRMTMPEPIGLEADVMSGLARLLDRLCTTLAQHHRGARRLRLELHRVDRETAQVEIGLARPMRDPERIAALFKKGVSEVEAGFGIEAMRLVAHVTEDLPPEQIGGPRTIAREDALADLFSRLGNRLGFDRVLRLLPATSKIPERSFLVTPAAYSAAEPSPPHRGPDRPIIIFPPEPVTTKGLGQPGQPPARFTWRRMSFTTLRADGPERIAPEWWFDDPAWRSGLRDYWRVETREGPRLWLYHTPQAQAWPVQSWFAQGEFA